jgi:hypothetical protein
MTHMRPMEDDEGSFGDWQSAGIACRSKCSALSMVRYRLWASNDGAYNDYQYHCQSCGQYWWIDGIDS